MFGKTYFKSLFIIQTLNTNCPDRQDSPSQRGHIWTDWVFPISGNTTLLITHMCTLTTKLAQLWTIFVCNKRLIDWLFFSSIFISLPYILFFPSGTCISSGVFPTLSNLYSLYSLVVPPAQIPVETEAAIIRWSWMAEIKEWNRPQDFTYKWTYSVKKIMHSVKINMKLQIPNYILANCIPLNILSFWCSFRLKFQNIYKKGYQMLNRYLVFLLFIQILFLPPHFVLKMVPQSLSSVFSAVPSNLVKTGSHNKE